MSQVDSTPTGSLQAFCSYGLYTWWYNLVVMS
uniref:Uncharacterized protein n=1 Tax=Anguilla anguilla TaxID=7936 RepID=A0A0E9QXP6_ANGAN